MAKLRNPLDQIFAQSSSITDEELTELLLPYFRIERRSGEAIPSEEFEHLSEAGRVLMVLHLMDAMHRLGLRKTPSITPSEMLQEFDILARSLFHKFQRLGLAYGTIQRGYIARGTVNETKQFLQNDKE